MKKLMKLYQFDLAPASKRVTFFLKETGIEVPIVQLNVRDGDQFEEVKAWHEKLDRRFKSNE